MKNAVKKVININNRKTSMQLNRLEWDALKKVCLREALSRNKLIETIENEMPVDSSLTSHVRLFMIHYFMELSPQIKALPSNPKIYRAHPPRHKILMDVLNNIK